MFKSFIICLMVLLGAILTDPGFTNFLGTMLLLCGGLWGGYLDGKKAGRREVLCGGSENPIK